MKLQACSKVISLIALSFTASAIGAFYTLNKAEQTIENIFQSELHSKLGAVGQDLTQYVDRINDDYYELVNMSLTNLLSLDESYYKKSPLLAFYNHNLRIASAYSSGENLPYALDSLAYYNIPYVRYDYASDTLQVHNASSDLVQKRILSAQNKDGLKLSELIKERPNLNHTFRILYSGNNTYLCLNIYDASQNANYFVIDSYLNVLTSLKLNVSNIFSDITPIMKNILGDEAVMIVRRNMPIFKTENFSLELDLDAKKISSFQGIHFVNQKGEFTSEPNTQEHYIAAVSYLKSISSFIVLERPYTLQKPDTSLYLFAKLALILIALVCIALVTRALYKDSKLLKQKHEKLTKIINRLNAFTPQEFVERYHQALVQAKQEIENESSLAKESTLKESNANTSLKDIAQVALAQNSDLALDPVKAIDTAETTISVKAKESDEAVKSVDAIESIDSKKSEEKEESSKAQAKHDDSTLVTSSEVKLQTETAQSEDKSKLSPETKSNQDIVSASEQNLSSQIPEANRQLENNSNEMPANLEVKSKANQESLNNTDEVLHARAFDILLKNFLNQEQIKLTSAESNIVKSSFQLASFLTLHHEQECELIKNNLKEDIKARIPLYRKEGQCVAARQMLLSAIPSEDAMPSSSFVDFAAFTVPARELTGNFYTLRRLDKENLAFVMGDCQSQGVKAAYTVAVVSTLIEEALKLALSPTEVLNYINERLQTMSNVANVALFVGMINEKTGNVIASNAGHCVPIVVDQEGARFVAEFNDIRLGELSELAESEVKFPTIKWFMAESDMIVLYSNGILNVKNNEGELFGLQRLLEHCNEAKLLRADELVIKILNDIKLHKGKRPFREDVSLISLKQLKISFLI